MDKKCHFTVFFVRFPHNIVSMGHYDSQIYWVFISIYRKGTSRFRLPDHHESIVSGFMEVLGGEARGWSLVLSERRPGWTSHGHIGTDGRNGSTTATCWPTSISYKEKTSSAACEQQNQQNHEDSSLSLYIYLYFLILTGGHFFHWL